MIISFLVPGNPIPWARAGGNGKRRYNDPKVTSYKELIGWHALRARNAANIKLGLVWPLDGIYSVTCVVHREDWSRIDGDRVLNNLADACNGILYEDDRHAFLRDGRFIIADPDPVRPHLGVLVHTRTPREQTEIANGFDDLIARRFGDPQR